MRLNSVRLTWLLENWTGILQIIWINDLNDLIYNFLRQTFDDKIKSPHFKLSDDKTSIKLICNTDMSKVWHIVSLPECFNLHKCKNKIITYQNTSLHMQLIINHKVKLIILKYFVNI